MANANNGSEKAHPADLPGTMSVAADGPPDAFGRGGQHAERLTSARFNPHVARFAKPGELKDKPAEKKPDDKKPDPKKTDEKNPDDKNSTDETKKEEKPETKDQEKPAGPPLYKKPLFWVILILVLAVAIIGGVLFWLHARQFESTDDAFIDAHMETIAPQVPARVLRVLVDDNQIVTAGQVLVELDPADYRARLAQANGNLAQTQGALKQAEANRISSSADAEQADAQVDVAKADARNAQADFERYSKLSAQAVSRQQLDNAKAAADRSTASVQAAAKKAAAARAQIETASAAIDSAQANIKASEAEVHAAELQLSYTTIRATLGGRVASRSVQEGNYVTTGQELLAIVPATVWITANFKETQLDLMRPGQPVEVAVDAYPNNTFTGHVDSIQAGSGAAFSLLPPENATGNYVKVVQRVPVKITFDNNDANRLLAPGMSVVPTVKVR